MPERDARLAQIVGRHLDVDAVAHADADEVLAHLSGDVGQDFVAVGECDAEHGARQDLRDRARYFDWFFFCQATLLPVFLSGSRKVFGSDPHPTGARDSIYGRRQCGFQAANASLFWLENEGGFRRKSKEHRCLQSGFGPVS